MFVLIIPKKLSANRWRAATNLAMNREARTSGNSIRTTCQSAFAIIISDIRLRLSSRNLHSLAR